MTSRAKIVQITRRSVRRAGGEGQNERENNGKAKCSYDEIGDQKTRRENGSRRCNENNRFPPRASKDIARVH